MLRTSKSCVASDGYMKISFFEYENRAFQRFSSRIFTVFHWFTAIAQIGQQIATIHFEFKASSSQKEERKRKNEEKMYVFFFYFINFLFKTMTFSSNTWIFIIIIIIIIIIGNNEHKCVSFGLLLVVH